MQMYYFLKEEKTLKRVDFLPWFQIFRSFLPTKNTLSYDRTRGWCISKVTWQKVLKTKLTKPGDFRGRGHFDLNLGHLKVTWSRVMAKFIQQNNTSAYSPQYHQPLPALEVLSHP